MFRAKGDWLLLHTRPHWAIDPDGFRRHTECAAKRKNPKRFASLLSRLESLMSREKNSTNTPRARLHYVQ